LDSQLALDKSSFSTSSSTTLTINTTRSTNNQNTPDTPGMEVRRPPDTIASRQSRTKEAKNKQTETTQEMLFFSWSCPNI